MTAGPGRLGSADPVHLLVPGDVDDPLRPSGGNAYDRRVRDGLRRAGRPVHQLTLPGDWPEPGPASSARLARELAALPDGATVLLDGLVGCAAPAVVLPQAARLDVVVLVHLPLGEEPGSPAGLPEREAQVLRAARAVIATSRWTADRLAGRHGLDPATVHVAVPGTDPAELAPGTDGAGGLLSVGSLGPTKGHDMLVDALTEVRGHDWRCRIVGPERRQPGFGAALRRTLGERGLDGRITLAGARAGAALDAEYAVADLLVAPSRVESYGMVVTEALARGIPVLASRTGGLPDALGTAAAPELLVPPGDPAGLTAALRRWLTDPDLRERARGLARARRDPLPRWDDTVAAVHAALTAHRPAALR